MATWSDNVSKTCKAALSFTPTGGSATSIASGTKLSEAGVLKLTVTDEFENAASGDISLTAVAIYGLEALQQLSLQVDQETDLLAGLTVAEGLTLTKVEIEQDGIRTEILAPYRYTPEFPGTSIIIFTLKDKNGKESEIKVDNLEIKALEYQAIQISNIKPVDILPII